MIRDDLCAERVTELRLLSHQCLRRRGYGPDGRYCKQHDPAVAEVRRRAADKAWNAKWETERREFRILALQIAAKMLQESGSTDAAEDCLALARNMKGGKG